MIRGHSTRKQAVSTRERGKKIHIHKRGLNRHVPSIDNLKRLPFDEIAQLRRAVQDQIVNLSRNLELKHEAEVKRQFQIKMSLMRDKNGEIRTFSLGLYVENHLFSRVLP